MAIERDQILLTRKLTDIEYRFTASNSDSWQFLKTLPGDEDTQRSLASHLRQMRNLRDIKKELSLTYEQQLAGETLSKEIASRYRMIIAFGGDDYGKYVSHFLDKQLLVLINSDTETSNGALMPFTTRSFLNKLDEILQGKFAVEDWTRLQASIDGTSIPELALSELFIGDPDRLKTTKYSFKSDEESVRVSNSGLIVATGAGSTGWYKAAASCKHEEAASFPRTATYARYVATEAFFSRLVTPTATNGAINQNETFDLFYSAHRPGVISMDSIHTYPIHRGQNISVKIAATPLSVVID